MSRSAEGNADLDTLKDLERDGVSDLHTLVGFTFQTSSTWTWRRMEVRGSRRDIWGVAVPFTSQPVI